MKGFLTVDEPAIPSVTPIDTTAEHWGRIPRTYIKCTKDNALPLSLQEKFIALADAFVPNNKTEVITLDTSHSPFISEPKELADEMIRAAVQI